MTIYNTIKTLLTDPDIQLETPENLCPNCWGRQEYQGKFFEAVKREGINTKNLTEKRGWIQAYTEQHLSGIQLVVSQNDKMCTSCGMKYIDEKK
ncbi:hypothetical protein N9F08_01000 [bacterium]|nr:hypothetical protein [bacterium]